MSVTQDHFYRPQPGPCDTTLCFSFDCAGHKFDPNVLIMMTLMLEPVSRKTVKKRLVSGWYSGSKRWWWWCSWVWQRHVSRPIVQRLKSLQNFTHNCQSFATNWKYISFLKEEKTTRTWTFPLVENSEQNMEILVVYMFCGWMWRQKSGISPYEHGTPFERL